MDPSAPWNVAAGGLITSGVGSLVGVAYGAFSNQPYLSLVWRSAVSSGIVGWTFFATRELVVSPALILSLPFKEYQRRRTVYGMSNPKDASEDMLQDLSPTSWSDLRRRYLLDSSLAGGLTGGFFSIIRRRPIVPGFVTAALLCSTIQYTFNETKVQRLKYLSRREARKLKATTIEEGQQQDTLPPPQHTWRQQAFEMWKSVLPRKLSDEEWQEIAESRKKSLPRPGQQIAPVSEATELLGAQSGKQDDQD